MQGTQPLYNRTEAVPESRVCADGLLVTGCGYYHSLGTAFPNARQSGRPDYQLLYIWRGSLTAQIDGNEITVKPGQLLLYKPREPQYYGLGKEGAELYWIRFTGAEAGPLLEHYFLQSGKIYTVGIFNQLKEIFSLIITERFQKKQHYEGCCAGQLKYLAALFSRYTQSSQNMAETDRHETLLPVIDDINRNYHENKTIDDYARMCNLGKYYFISLFTKYVGCPPIAYRTEIRMQQAKLLLSSTACSIQEIALLCGYSNQHHFSKMFKKYTNESPKQFRTHA